MMTLLTTLVQVAPLGSTLCTTMINQAFSKWNGNDSPMNMSSMGMMGYPYMMGGGMYPSSMMSMGGYPQMGYPMMPPSPMYPARMY